MATKVLTKHNIRPIAKPDADVDEEVETKAEKVVVTKALAVLINGWDKAEKAAEAYWPKIVQFVIENETTRDELRQALVDLRGMKKITANNELSVIYRVAEFEDEVRACIEGDDNPDTGEPWQVRDLRKLGVKTQEGTGRDPEDSFKKRIRNVAKYAIEEAQLELADFIAECKAAYKEEHAKAEAAAVRAAEKDGEPKEEEDGESEEE
jgi:hypothetical protein